MKGQLMEEERKGQLKKEGGKEAWKKWRKEQRKGSDFEKEKGENKKCRN